MHISVALCTFNGARYLAQQLESIADQSFLPCELVVCDDGSDDNTLEILKEFVTCVPFPVSVCVNERRLGVVANFYKAIQLCRGDFVSFSDQDDVWLTHKLESAMRRIGKSSDPENALYCTRLRYVNSDLEDIALSPVPSELGFYNAIAENVATGCTVVFGSQVRDRLLRAQPKDMVMHDWWAYLIASAYGEVIFDSEPGVLYRQHGENVTGRESKPRKLWNRALWLAKRLREGRKGMDSLNQAERFVRIYPDVPSEFRRKIEELLALRDDTVLARLRYLLGKPCICRNDYVENLALKIMILCGWH